MMSSSNNINNKTTTGNGGRGGGGKEAVCFILDGYVSMNEPVTTITTTTPDTSEKASSSTINDNNDGKASSQKGPNRPTTTTRFDIAKGVAIDFISSLMIRSKTHEVSVFVLNTKETQHHLYSSKGDIVGDDTANDDDMVEDGSGGSSDTSMDDDDDSNDTKDIVFPHITELSGNGYQDSLRPPWPGLLRQINKLKISTPPPQTPRRQQQPQRQSSRSYQNDGGIISGIILAADALHKRTHGKKYHRRIVVVTDAQQHIQLHEQHNNKILIALDKLREMECELQVVGFDFERTSDYNTMEMAPTVGHGGHATNDQNSNRSDDKAQEEHTTTQKSGNGGDNNDDDNNDNFSTGGSTAAESETTDMEEDDEEDEDECPMDIKRRNENLLHNLSAKTGGFVFSANDRTCLVNKIWGNKVVKSSKKKLIFEIAPGIVLNDIRCYLWMGTTKLPGLKTRIAITSSVTGDVQKNSIGQEMVQDYSSHFEFWSADDENVEVIGNDVTEGYRFGSDYIAYNPLDEAGLSHRSEVKLTVFGYLPQDHIPPMYLMGEPYILTGVDSRRSCAAISALSQALYRTNRVALATFVKTKDRAPILMSIFPLVDEEQEQDTNSAVDVNDKTNSMISTRLMMIQIPFTPEIVDNDFDSLRSSLRIDNPRIDLACDDLIDSMMLPKDALDYTKVDNPCIESFYKTAVQRVLDPKAKLVTVNVDDGCDQVQQSSKARKALQNFETALPRTKEGTAK